MVNTHERILCFAKDKRSFEMVEGRGEVPLELKDMKRYSKILVDAGAREEVARFTAPSTGEPVVIYKHSGERVDSISLRSYESRKEEINAIYVDNLERVFRNTSIQEENEFQNRVLGFCGRGLYSADYLVSRGRRQGELITSYY